MKTIFKVTTVIALLLTTTLSMANGLKMRLKLLNETRSLVLSLENDSEDLSIQLTDIDINVIYLEKLEDGTRNKIIDLARLKDGTYYFPTSDFLRHFVYTVSLDEDIIRILEREEVAKPYFRKTNEKVFLNFLNLNKSKVDIKVYDEEYRVLFSETVTETMIVEKAFNFKGAYAGNYKVVVSNAEKTYSETFVVD